MSAKRRLRRRACENKKIYYSLNAVKYKSKELKGLRYTGGYYKCPFCKKWHIGRIPKRIKTASKINRSAK